MDSQFKYYAFVSYRSSDEKYAKWLQEKIEAYRLPTTVQRMSSNLPKQKLRPCFRYHTDIQPNELKTELHNKLEQSQYLLVICTPRSAQSPWVGAEIDTFVELGRRDKIIPVIFEGRPYSNDPATECYNPSLLKHFPHSDNIDEDKEILGVNIHEEGAGSAGMKRERAVIQIVSRMLNLNFDQLWQRERRRIRQRRICWSIGILFVLALIGMTYVFNQPFDTHISIQPQETEHSQLPPLHNATIILSLPDEDKSETLLSAEQVAHFVHIPARMKGKEVQLHISAPDFLPLDTLINLSEAHSIPLQRDELVYGKLRATVLSNFEPCPNMRILVDGHETQTDDNGRFELFIPLHEQKTEYEVINAAGNRRGILFAPCGENDIVEL